MEDTRRVRPYIALGLTCVLAIAISWLLGRLGLGLAFTLGSALTIAVVVLATAAAPAVRLTAATMATPEGWQEFHRELARARRFDRPFGIVRFVDVGSGVVSERRVRDRVAVLARRIDRVWLDGGDLFVLLPESDAAAVETAVERARYRVREALDVAVTATFPANGITSGALIACLYQGDASPVAIGALAPVPSALASVAASEADELAETAT